MQSDAMIFPARSQPTSLTRMVIVGLSILGGAVALDGYAADVTFRWDYSTSQPAGFVLYCGASPRSYSTRIDVGNTDTFTLALAGGSLHFCAVTAYEPSGAESTFSDEIAVSVREETGTVAVVAPINVRSVFLTGTGFRVLFSSSFDPTRLNLYGSQAGGEGPADVTLVGASSGPVRGSLVPDEFNQLLTFVKTGGVLVPDTYTLTIASRLGRLIDMFGPPINIDGAGVFGDDYRLAFAVAPVNTPVLSIGEFARGPGQRVNLPAADPAAGIPIRISHGAAVQDVAFMLQYNPALLCIQDVNLAASVSGNLTLKLIDQPSGLVWVRVENLSGLSDASTILLTLQAKVPTDAPYGSQHVLQLSALSFNGVATGWGDDDGLHVVAKLGDASGARRYSSFDALLIQRVIVRLDSGFSAYPLTDPVVVGDVNGSGRLDSDDARLVQLKVLRQAVPEIPD